MTAPASTPGTSAARILATYLAATAALRSQLLGLVTALFASQGDYREAAAETFVASAVPAVAAAQQTMAAFTSAYLTDLIAAMAGGTSAPPGIPVSVSTGARAVDPAIVYRRPYIQIWTDLSRGKPFPQAVVDGQRRLESLAATDLELAKTHTAQAVMRDDKRVVGYRRVLTGPYSCALCVIASTQRYHKKRLMDIHPGCDCAVQPIFGVDDPGRVIDEVALETLHKTVERDLGAKYVDRGGRDPLDYRKIIVTHDHSEIGPVLGVRDHNFQGPVDIPRLTHRALSG